MSLLVFVIFIAGIAYLRRKRDEREANRRAQFINFLRKVWPWAE